ncbi:acyltransferase papA1 domain protein [Mycobacterium ulcerans str. Harvey]|uniref:Acyltransferase papA1 domain protein n=1 Tax=Mycobacterium ulcerans str. Harvey TaxID=1299332 RepID=A0ABN0RAN2_MYCUL|nr:acyltransferase papA1 domain protein [Mycobacterium ulcerans str. Harvey]
MDERQTLAFEAACMSAGARFCGGVFAISAVVQHELTGADEYYAIVQSTSAAPKKTS